MLPQWSNNTDGLCHAYNSETQGLNSLLSAIMLIAAIYNGVVFVAMTKSGHLLRHNMVFMYVKSCLVSSMILCLCGAYQNINAVTRFESIWTNSHDGIYNNSIPSHRIVMQWSAITFGITLGLIMTSCASITLLVYGISSTAYYATKFSLSRNLSPNHLIGITDKGTIHLGGKKVEFNKKRLKAGLLIAASWVIPCVIAVGCTVLPLTCAQYCVCLPSFYPKGINNDLNCVHGQRCSRLYIGMSRRFMAGVASFWLVFTVANYTLISTVLIKFYYETKESSRHGADGDEKHAKSLNCSRKSNRCKLSIMPTARLPSALKVVIVIALSNTLSYLPLISCMFHDSLSVGGPNPIVNLVSLALGGIYLIALPSILISYMAALRKSLLQIFLRFKCFTSVTVTKSTIPKPVKSYLQDGGIETNEECQEVIAMET